MLYVHYNKSSSLYLCTNSSNLIMATDLGTWTPLAKKYHPLQAGSIDGTDTEPHDRAVVRAMGSTYKPNHLVKGDPECTLFVGRLNRNTTEETLQEEFSQYGDIKSLRLVRDVVTGFSKRYAFVEYYDNTTARGAMRKSSDIEIDGESIYVDYEIERNLEGWIPRRLGGGFGGKKESGQLRFGGRDRPFRKPIMVKREMTETSGSRWSIKLYDDNRPQDGNRYRDSRDERDYRWRHRSRSRDRSRRDYRDRDRERDRDKGRDRDRYRDRGREDDRDSGRRKEREDDKYKSKYRDKSRSKDRNN